jgi:hypothetical protein
VRLYLGPGSNRHGHYCPQDFKSGVSTNSTTEAWDKFKKQIIENQPPYPI